MLSFFININWWLLLIIIEKIKKILTKQKNDIIFAASPRKEKMADFLIDVAKYIFTGVIITSLFNDVSNKTILYLEGAVLVILTLSIGLVITNKRKE